MRRLLLLVLALLLLPSVTWADDEAPELTPGVFAPRMDAVWIPNDTSVDPGTFLINKPPTYKPGSIRHHIIVYQGKDEPELGFIDLRYKGVTLEWDKLTPETVIVDPLRVTFEGGFFGAPLAGRTLIFRNTVGPGGVFINADGLREVDEVRTVVGGTVFDDPTLAAAFGSVGIFPGAVAGVDFSVKSRLLELPDGSIQ